MKTVTFAALPLVLLAAPAFAADGFAPAPEMPKTPMMESTTDWTGFYAGANAGYANGEADVENLDPVEDIEGYFIGAQAGYNVMFDGLVLGVEADIQYADLSRMEDELFEGGVGEGELGLDYFGTVRARAGYAIDAFMPYLTGGLAYGRSYGETEVNGFQDEGEETHYGFAVGGGVELAVIERFSLKGEYLFLDLNEEEYGDTDVDPQFHTIRAGVNARF